MFLAELPDGSRVTPTATGQRAVCPGCRSPVLSRCGEIVAHHWAHESGSDCDPWSEPESPWHLGWKALFPEPCREVVMPPHRADISVNGRVVELQHSPISSKEIAEREAFYGPGLVWIFDASLWANDDGVPRLSLTSSGVQIFWRQHDRSVFRIRQTFLIDGLRPDLLWHASEARLGAGQFLTGFWIQKENFVEALLDSLVRISPVYPSVTHRLESSTLISAYKLIDARIPPPPDLRPTSARGGQSGPPPTSASPFIGAEVAGGGQTQIGRRSKPTTTASKLGGGRVACYVCSGTDWWTSIWDVVICRRCHPPAISEIERKNHEPAHGRAAEGPDRADEGEAPKE